MRHRSEALLGDLVLRGGDGGGGVGVGEAAALLPVLELGALGRADADGGGVDLGAAGGPAVVVGDAAARGELGVLAVADVLGAGVVGGQGEGGDGDCFLGEGGSIMVSYMAWVKILDFSSPAARPDEQVHGIEMG